MLQKKRQQASQTDGVTQQGQGQRRYFGHHKTRGHNGHADLHAGGGGCQQGQVGFQNNVRRITA